MSPVTVVRFEFISPPASFSSFSRRPVITTCAPSSTKRLAVAKPIPLLAPVMTATLPSSFFIVVYLSLRVLFFILLQSLRSVVPRLARLEGQPRAGDGVRPAPCPRRQRDQWPS